MKITCVFAGLVFGFFGSLAGAGGAEGNFTPFTAKYRTVTTKIGPNGQETIVQEEHGVHYRSRGGDDLKRALKGDLDNALASAAEYRNLPTGELYQILYHRRKAVLRMRGLGVSGPRTVHSNAVKAAKQDVINGIPCTIAEFKSNRPGTVGAACYSNDYDIAMKIETDYSTGDEKIRVVFEHYDVRLGVEPDPAEVGIPPGFEIIRWTGPPPP